MNIKVLFIFVLTLGIIKCNEISILNQTKFIVTKFYSLNGYNLTIKNTDSKLNAAVQQRLTEIYFDIYPRLINRFNTNAPRSIHVFIDGLNKYPYWGLAVDSTIIINSYRLRNPTSFARYYDIFLHELAHLVQQYTTRNLADVKWLGEGLADYVRYRYGGSNIDADWSLPDYTNKQFYYDSYKVTARFLIWLENKYNSSVIEQLDKGLRDVTYKQNTTWNELTGQSIEKLWLDYSRNSDLIANIPFIQVTKTFENDNITDDDPVN
ncbi:unnamed protein product [Adineta steineri]|uniref:Secretory protein n=1 Tax=Adineta steineri TaxID=433720 RepID=A0A815E4E2_9BILA|nr:unnamed protein product [Adineta steineri]CAF1359786.1 unnamed protein product [Adineta steineri]CAF3605531.1 unnamed protein product [Adineta steineri]CAF3636308.1 unnamed protein product [Adineta steineri]